MPKLISLSMDLIDRMSLKVDLVCSSTVGFKNTNLVYLNRNNN